MIALTFALMFGALFGWLAPAIVSLGIIAALLVAAYYPPRWLFDPFAAYTGTAVAAMERRW